MVDRELNEQVYEVLKKDGRKKQSELIDIFKEHPMLNVMESIVYLRKEGKIRKTVENGNSYYQIRET